MSREAAAASDGADAPFPPIVQYRVFKDVVQRLASKVPLAEILSSLPSNDRSQARRALIALELMTPERTLDEVTIRRLADPDTRSSALRTLLWKHYATQVQAAEKGVTAEELADLLRVPGRASNSAAEKARQFLIHAMAEAGLEASIRRTPTRLTSASPSSAGRHGRPSGPATSRTARALTAEKYERFADQLLDRHNQVIASGSTDEELEARIERVLEVLARLRTDA